MSHPRLGDFRRGYAICEYILNGHTLKEAVEEFRISKKTIMKDINRVGLVGLDCKELDPEKSKKLFRMYVDVREKIYPGYFQKERNCTTCFL